MEPRSGYQLDELAFIFMLQTVLLLLSFSCVTHLYCNNSFSKSLQEKINW